VILKGFPQDYESVLFVIESRLEHLIEEAEALLLAQESQLKKFQKKVVLSCASVNLIQAPRLIQFQRMKYC